MWACWRHTRDQPGPRRHHDSAVEPLRVFRPGRAGVARGPSVSRGTGGRGRGWCDSRDRPSPQLLPLCDEEVGSGSCVPRPMASWWQNGLTSEWGDSAPLLPAPRCLSVSRPGVSSQASAVSVHGRSGGCWSGEAAWGTLARWLTCSRPSPRPGSCEQQSSVPAPGAPAKLRAPQRLRLAGILVSPLRGKPGPEAMALCCSGSGAGSGQDRRPAGHRPIAVLPVLQPFGGAANPLPVRSARGSPPPWERHGTAEAKTGGRRSLLGRDRPRLHLSVAGSVKAWR